jgi:hypothetical protein
MLATIGCPYLRRVQNDIKLTKLDANLNVIWTKQYGSYMYNDIPRRLLVVDTEYVIASIYNNSNLFDTGFFDQTQIMRLDTSGRMLWQWLSDTRKLEVPVNDIIKTKDGGFVYCGMGNGYEYRRIPSYGYKFVKGYIAKIDASGTRLWSDTFGIAYSYPNSNFGDMTALIEMSDSSIMVAGNIYGNFTPLDSPEWQFNTLMKLTPRGDLVWRRKYHYAYYLISQNYDLRQTPDGGFVMCGQSIDELRRYDSTVQQGWVLKVDGDGCLSLTDPQCHPTVVPDVGWQQDIGVYPNPVSSLLTIDVPVSLREWQLEVFDMLGRKMLTHQSAYMREKIDVSPLTPGVYTYHLTTEGMVIKSGKIAKY